MSITSRLGGCQLVDGLGPRLQGVQRDPTDLRAAQTELEAGRRLRGVFDAMGTKGVPSQIVPMLLDVAQEGDQVRRRDR